MFPLFLILLWLVTLGMGVRLLMVSSGRQIWVWKRLVSQWKGKTDPISLLDRMLQRKWLTKPRWFVGITTNKEKLAQKILLSGDVIRIDQFLGLKQAMVTIFLIYFWIYIWFGDLSWKNTFWLIIIYGIGYVLPDLWLQVQKEKREKRLYQEVPYFIDLLALTLQTGMNVEQALRYISGKKKGDLAELVRDQMQYLAFGKRLDEVLQVLRDTVPITEWQNFISSIVQSKKLGVSLAHTLEIQSEIIRTRRRQRAEELSRTAAVKISLPLVLFIFPALLIIYIGPGLIHLMQGA